MTNPQHLPVGSMGYHREYLPAGAAMLFESFHHGASLTTVAIFFPNPRPCSAGRRGRGTST